MTDDPKHVSASTPTSLAGRVRSCFHCETLILFALIALLVFLLLLYNSGGHWSDWPASSTYYNQLADAFLHGQTHLLSEPDPRLANLSDPYSEIERKGVPALWDASYYNGHYYLYWGPVPAVGVVLFRTMVNIPIGDNMVVLFATLGILLSLVLILFQIRHRFFPQLPSWILYLTISAVVLGNPLLWILNRPLVYEASIAGGQMFLLAGLCILLPNLYSTKKPAWRYLLSSILWALSIGTRVSLAGAVGALAVGASVILFRSALRREQLAIKLACLYLPLLMGTALLGGYNYIRFGNPLEFGLRYQLTDNDYTKPTNAILAAWNAPLNVYNYFARPVSVHRSFPFITPRRGKASFHPLPFPTPSLYYSEPVTGLLISTPFLLCVFGLCLSTLPPKWLRLSSRDSPVAFAPRSIPDPAFRGFCAILFVAGILAFAPLLFYWYCSERFILDFVPLFLILSACGAWNIDEHFLSNKRWRSFFLVLISGWAIWTVAVNILLGVTGYGNHW
jgi:hypothetical protein